MNTPAWHDRPAQTYFGPSSWQNLTLGWVIRIFVRTTLTLLTFVGAVVNRFFPGPMQRARLDVIDEPMRAIPPLPGTEITPVRLEHCPAEWVVAPGARGSRRVVIYFHGSALVTLGLNSHRRFVSKLSAATGAQVFNVGYRLAPRATASATSSLAFATAFPSMSGPIATPSSVPSTS